MCILDEENAGNPIHMNFVEVSEVQPQRKSLGYSNMGKILAKERKCFVVGTDALVMNSTST